MRRSIWEQIRNRLNSIDYEILELKRSIKTINEPPITIQLDTDNKILDLPDYLRKTFLVISMRGESNANQVSIETGKSRATESAHLNQLVRMNYLCKKKKVKTMYFKINPKYNQ